MLKQQIENILPFVEKPARYTGGELNSVVKNLDEVEVRFAFCFADVYEVGMSHLGMKILYSAINERKEFWCERVFAPWIDMEEEMRKHNVPLFALESMDAVKNFDFIGFTLQYEMCYSNIINMLDLSGVPLHKRGYRPERVEAPIRETLAAAMVKLARPRENVLLWDPFCGSGTIAIEAAMMMKNIAPGLKRTFAAEEYPIFPAESWTKAREEAEAAIKHDTQFEAYATDINDECVRIATESAARAGVADMISVFKMDALDIDTLGKRGTIVTNPPYGERLLTVEEAESLYRAMGEAFARLEKWQIYVITQSEVFPKLYGRRADKIRKLYNGMIPCYYYQFFKNGDKK